MPAKQPTPIRADRPLRKSLCRHFRGGRSFLIYSRKPRSTSAWSGGAFHAPPSGTRWDSSAAQTPHSVVRLGGVFPPAAGHMAVVFQHSPCKASRRDTPALCPKTFGSRWIHTNTQRRPGSDDARTGDQALGDRIARNVRHHRLTIEQHAARQRRVDAEDRAYVVISHVLEIPGRAAVTGDGGLPVRVVTGDGRGPGAARHRPRERHVQTIRTVARRHRCGISRIGHGGQGFCAFSGDLATMLKAQRGVASVNRR